MTSNPFLLSSPQDMLAKARRDLERLKSESNADAVFNFFVTAYHVMDYVNAMATVSQSAISKMYSDPDFDMCRFICNRGKHLCVTNRPKTVDIRSRGSAQVGAAQVGDAQLGSGGTWTFICDGKEINPEQLAVALIEKWEQFFIANGIA